MALIKKPEQVNQAARTSTISSRVATTNLLTKIEPSWQKKLASSVASATPLEQRWLSSEAALASSKRWVVVSAIEIFQVRARPCRDPEVALLRRQEKRKHLRRRKVDRKAMTNNLAGSANVERSEPVCPKMNFLNLAIKV